MSTLRECTRAFADVPVPAMERLAASAQRIQASAGAVVFGEGAAGDRFYVIVTGEAEVCVRGHPIAVLGPGESFGEIALLRSVPRTASGRALSDLDMRALDAATFVPAVSGYSASASEAETSASFGQCSRQSTRRPSPAPSSSA